MRILLAAIVAISATAHADDVKPPELAQAIQRAATEGKPLLLLFSTSWCEACRQFESTTLADSGVQRRLDEVVFVHYDAEVAPGDAAAQRFAITAYPTLLIVDQQGVERARHVGGMAVGPFVELLGSARDKVEDERAIRARLKAHPLEPTAELAAARWFLDHGRAIEALSHYEQIARIKTATATQRAEAFAAGSRIRRQTTWRNDLVAEKLATIQLDPLTANLDDLALATIHTDLPLRDVRALYARVLAAQTDVDRTNAIIYLALAAGAGDEALAAGKKMIETRADAQHLDTLAECYFVAGDSGEAVSVEDRALAIAQGAQLEPLLRENRSRFAAGTGKSHEVIDLEARVDETWKKLADSDQLAQQARGPDPRFAQRMAQHRAQFQAVWKLQHDAATSCQPQAGNAKEAYARLALDPQGKVTATTLLLEPSATAALRDCLTKALAAGTVPPVDGQLEAHVFVRFH